MLQRSVYKNSGTLKIICFCILPIQEKKTNNNLLAETWLTHPELEEVKKVQAKVSRGEVASAIEEEVFSSDDDESVSRGQDSQSQDAGSESSGSEDHSDPKPKNKFAFLPEDECA